MALSGSPEGGQIPWLFQSAYVQNFRGWKPTTIDKLEPEHGVNAFRIADRSNVVARALYALKKAATLQFRKSFAQRSDSDAKVGSHLALGRKFLAIDQSSCRDIANQKLGDLEIHRQATAGVLHLQAILGRETKN
jgi:hypothetical protein